VERSKSLNFSHAMYNKKSAHIVLAIHICLAHRRPETNTRSRQARHVCSNNLTLNIGIISGICIPREWEDHVNVGPVSDWEL